MSQSNANVEEFRNEISRFREDVALHQLREEAAFIQLRQEIALMRSQLFALTIILTPNVLDASVVAEADRVARSRLPSPQFEENACITITPIAQTSKKKLQDSQPDSHRDYAEQCERLGNGVTMWWDDAKGNKTKEGDVFGFRHQDKCVEIHRVTQVFGTQHRLQSWSRNVGQSDRNVLQLTNPLCEIPWNDWATLGWHAEGTLMGTQRVMQEESRITILKYINNRIANLGEV